MSDGCTVLVRTGTQIIAKVCQLERKSHLQILQQLFALNIKRIFFVDTNFMRPTDEPQGHVFLFNLPLLWTPEVILTPPSRQ